MHSRAFGVDVRSALNAWNGPLLILALTEDTHHATAQGLLVQCVKAHRGDDMGEIRSALASNLEGAVNLGLRNLPAARASFEKALTLDPAYWQAAENLAQLDLNAKKPEAVTASPGTPANSCP